MINDEIEIELDRDQFTNFLLERLERKQKVKLLEYLSHLLADEDGCNSAQFKIDLAKWLHETTGKVAKGSEWLLDETSTPAEMQQESPVFKHDSMFDEGVPMDFEVVDGLEEVVHEFVAEYYPQVLTFLAQHPQATVTFILP